MILAETVEEVEKEVEVELSQGSTCVDMNWDGSKLLWSDRQLLCVWGKVATASAAVLAFKEVEKEVEEVLYDVIGLG